MPHAARPPLLAHLPTELPGSELDALAHDATYTETELVDVELPGQHARGVSLDTVRLTGVDLSGSQLEHLSLSDVRLSGCSLANVQARGASVTRVAITSSRLTGIALTEAAMHDVTVEGCRIDLASLRHTEFRRSDLSDLEGVQSLRGAAMEWADIVGMAGLWATALGIEILDAE